MIPAHKLSADKVKEFFFAGNATLTLRNSNTGNRFTYKIHTPKEQENEKKPVFFVDVLNGSDNETSYAFAGTIFGKGAYRHSKKSTIKEDVTSVKVIKAFIEFLALNIVPKGIEVWHEGKCGKCGRKLTVPESIYTGIGPECFKNLEKAQLELELISNDKGITHNVIQAFKSQNDGKI